jgi:hypothetical protein
MEAFCLSENKCAEQKLALLIQAEPVIIFKMTRNDRVVKSFLLEKRFVLAFYIQTVNPGAYRTVQYDNAEDHQENDQDFHKVPFFLFGNAGTSSTETWSSQSFGLKKWVFRESGVLRVKMSGHQRRGSMTLQNRKNKLKMKAFGANLCLRYKWLTLSGFYWLQEQLRG